MAEKNSAKNKMSKEECMQALVSTINRNMKFKFRGYRDGSKDLIFEATHSRIFDNDPIFGLCFYEIELEKPLCCFLKHKFGNLKINNFLELRELMSKIHCKEAYYNEIKQKQEEVGKMLEELTEKLRGIGGVLDNRDLSLLNQKLYISDIEFKKQKILDLAQQKGINNYEKKELSDMMDKILELYRDVTYDSTMTRIYSRMLFGSGKYRAMLSVEKLKKFGIVDDTNPLPEDYPLIENEIINTMDELLDILSLFYNNKVYLCLNFYKFRKALIKRIVGKEKLIEIIASANDGQLEKLADLEASMSKDYREYDSMLQVFLASSQDSDKIQRVLNFVLEHENLTADVAADFRTNMLKEFDVKKNFYNNNIQISVDSFERLLNAKYKSQKEKIFYLTDDDLNELLELLEGGVKCCSEDINKNNKKVDLKKIFDGVQIKLGTFLLEEYYLSKFINFVFANINKIKLDGQLMHFICSSFLTSYNRKIIKNKRFGVVIGAILKEQNFEYKDGTNMLQEFKQRCTEFGISASCDQDSIFLVGKKLYLVDKDVGINQFNNVEEFFEYVFSNVNTPEGKRYFNLLMRLTNDENNIFVAEEKLYLVDKDDGILQFDSLDNFVEYVYLNINTEKGERYTNYLSKFFDYNFNRYANSEWGTHIEAKINDDCCMVSNVYVSSLDYYHLSLISKILESQGETRSLSDKFENARSKWNRWNGFDSFCFKFYMYVIFPLSKRFQSQPPQPKIINIDKVLQSKESNGNEVSMVPKSEKRSQQIT
ncbi:MAG: hypothetical protein IJU86_04275 [Firmicutes bacterium]|nr:hypothetical protein [Bacillota bacterium]